MQRALGDFKYKRCEGLSPERQPVCASPDVVVHDRTPHDLLLFLACDGIWDVLSDADVAGFLQGQLCSLGEDGTASFRPEDLATACDAIVALCLEKNSEDNMTAMAIHLGGAC